MTIETERLTLLPLVPSQLRRWVEDIPALEAELRCSYRAEPMEGMFLEIVNGQLEITERDPENFVWHSFWLLIRRSDRVIVGAADFKDVPNAEGEVEIGYGLGSEFEKNGYMTESVRAMCEWALRQDGVRHITAETDLDGLSSQRILLRCGFSERLRADTVWWRL